MTNLTIKELQDFNDTQREIIEQQQGDINGLRKDVEHWREAWRRSVEESTTLKTKIEQLHELLCDARDDVAEIAGQQVKAHRIEQYRCQLAEIDKALGKLDER